MSGVRAPRPAVLLLISALTALAAVSTAAFAADDEWWPAHDQAMRRAQVWFDPGAPVRTAALAGNPDERFDRDQIVSCRFDTKSMSGNSPKFDCIQPDGTTIRVKYGASNPEVFAEVIATRLFTALGFPTDSMYVVGGVRCHGCPDDPFTASFCLHTGTTASCFGTIDYTRSRLFDPAVIERQRPGRRVEHADREGWGWYELAKIDPAAGGAPRAQVDALRLMAVFLAHWDNKPENQRLSCEGDGSDDRCEQPVALVQDLGGSFGPLKMDVTRWRAYPVWADAASCQVSMHALPYGGSSFPDARISEGGRRFLAERLGRLTRAEVRGLFAGARVADYTGGDSASRSVDRWVEAFMHKVGAVVRRPPCPEL